MDGKDFSVWTRVLSWSKFSFDTSSYLYQLLFCLNARKLEGASVFVSQKFFNLIPDCFKFLATTSLIPLCAFEYHNQATNLLREVVSGYHLIDHIRYV